MGCGSSKLEEQEAVTHCRERSTLLADAIRYRYALADAHGAYMKAVESLAPALSAFLSPVQGPMPPSPLLTLPTQRKGDPVPLQPVPGVPVQPIQNGSHSNNNRVSHSRSHSDGSHIHFHSSDEDEESEHGSHIHFHSDDEEEGKEFTMDPRPVLNPTRFNMHYAKSQPPNPSVSYEQRLPENPQTVYPSYYNNIDPYQPESSNLYPPSYPSYPSYPPYSSSSYSGYGEPNGGGYFGNFASPAEPAPPREEIPPPAPPSPPQVSTWDFLNPFESYDSYYVPPYTTNTPSRSSKELRDEEGIPDLEDDQVVVKAAYGDEKAGPSNKGKGKGDGSASDPHWKPRDLEVESTSTSTSNEDEAGTSGLDHHEIHVVDKNVVKEGETARKSISNLPVPVSKTYNDDSEVVREIKSQFDKVLESANQVSGLLEVGKQPYQQKNSPLKDSLRMMCGLPSISGSQDDFLNFQEDNAISSTLQKLYMWENKLLQEVKNEEKMRVLYERKRQELRYHDERGAESEKIERIEKFIRKLSTRISIAMQVVSTISNKINVLRDQELWPQICLIIQGFTKMWISMLESHRIQSQAIISLSKNLDSLLSAPHLSSTHLDATKTLELNLLEWTSCFSSWISLQKSYVRTLNDWLIKGLDYKEEITEDGPVPFSPGRLGAPIIFGVLNQWANSMDLVSEREVGVAMKELGFRVLRVWEGYQFEQRQSLMANREGMDRAIRVLEKEEQEMRKKVGLIEIFSNGEKEMGSVKEGLERVFEEMRGFCEGFVGVYEGLNVRIQEEKNREE